MDYLIEVDGAQFRTQIETHAALAQGLMFGESEACMVMLHSVHWFKAGEIPEGRR
jgi:hypothetical protein